MALSVKTEGFEEIGTKLAQMQDNIASGVIGVELGKIMEEGRRFAASISPVRTGSYRDAHRVAVGEMNAVLFVDPLARNTETGTPVIRYAGAIEERLGVYARTGELIYRLAESKAQVLAEAVMSGN